MCHVSIKPYAAAVESGRRACTIGECSVVCSAAQSQAYGTSIRSRFGGANLLVHFKAVHDCEERNFLV